MVTGVGYIRRSDNQKNQNQKYNDNDNNDNNNNTLYISNNKNTRKCTFRVINNATVENIWVIAHCFS